MFVMTASDSDMCHRFVCLDSLHMTAEFNVLASKNSFTAR